jgi:predicted GNAT family acetyltransferase
LTLTTPVAHDIPGQRFLAQFAEGRGVLSYEKVGARTLDLQHTKVDESLRGKGVAEALAKAAFAYIRENHLLAIATCSYIQRWLERHPEQRDVVVTKAE